MSRASRTQLLGRYRTPKFRIGDVVHCAMRGEVRITGMTEARMPWPVGQAVGKRARGPVIYADLEVALLTESNVAVSHWWGVTPQTVTKWRRALGVEPGTAGTRRLRQAWGGDPDLVRARTEGLRKKDMTKAYAKMSEARRGTPRSAAVKRKLRLANLGKRPSEETRAKMRRSHSRRRR